MVMSDAPAVQADATVTIALLANHPDLIQEVGEIRWAEWGKPPEPTELEFWIDVTRREAGVDGIPVTWVAIDASGRAVGAVGILEFDPEKFRDRSPWLVGMVVHPDRRRQSIGSQLVRELEAWALRRGFIHVWVATGPPDGPAEAFYRSCGWNTAETFVNATDEVVVVLERRLDA